MSRNPIEQSLIADEQRPKSRTAFAAVLSKQTFRRLLIGQFISSMGDWLIIGILVPTVIALSGGSSFAVAGILAAKLIPALIINPYTSVFTEHLNNRRTMIAADLLRALIVLFLLGSESLFAIYAVIFAMESCTVFFFPARNALVPILVSEESEQTVARGILFTATQAGLIFGLVFSGAILASFESLMRLLISLDVERWFDPLIDVLSPVLFGAKAGIAVDSLTFVLSALILWRLPDDIKAACAEIPERISFASIKRNTTATIEFIREHIEFRRYIVTVLLVLLGGAAVIAVGLNYFSLLNGMPPFSDQLSWITDLRGARYAFFLSFFGIGIVAGAIFGISLEKRFGRQVVFPLAVLSFGLAMLFFSLTDSMVLATMFATLASFSLAVLLLNVVRYIISEIDDSLKYRVMVVIDPLVRLSILLSLIVVVPFSGGLTLIIKTLTRNENLFGLAIVGPRATLILGSLIVLGASVFAIRSLLLQEIEHRAQATDMADEDGAGMPDEHALNEEFEEVLTEVAEELGAVVESVDTHEKDETDL